MAVLGRSQPIRAHLAKPVVAPGAGFLKQSATIVRAAGKRSYLARTVPRPHLPRMQTLSAAAAPPAPPPVVVKADQSHRPRRAPAPHLASPAVVAPGGPVTVVGPPNAYTVGRSIFRPYMDRRRIIGAHLAPPNLTPPAGPTPPRAPPVIVTPEQTAQNRLRRAPPPHLADGIVAPGGPAVVNQPFVNVFDRQPFRRPYVGRATPRPHLATAVQGVAPTGPPAPPGLFVGQAVKRVLQPVRRAPSPHLAGGIVAPAGSGFLKQSATVVRAAARRALLGRTVPRPHLPQILAIPPAAPVAPLAPAVVVSLDQIGRLRLRRAPPPHVPPPIAAPGGQPMPGLVRTGLFPRPTTPTPRPHLAAPTLAAAAAAAPVTRGTFITALRRALLGRTTPKPHTAAPVAAPGGARPVPAPTPVVISQALRRTQTGRTTPRPHLAAGLTTPFVPFPPFPGPIVVGQGERRPHIGRTIPKPHLPLANLQPQPFPEATVVGQALRRVLVGRRTPAPHLAPPNLTQTTVPPVAAGLFVAAARRALLGRTVPRPHIAAPVAAPGGPTPVPRPAAVVVLQSIRRTLIGRRTPAPHLAQGVTSPFVPFSPVPPGLFVGQGERRPHLGRTGPPRPHLAQPVVSPGRAAVPPATMIVAALRRALVGRATPRPHLPPANLQPQPFPGARVFAQALRRVFAGRDTPSPHTAGPIVSPPPFTAPAPLVVSQGVPRRNTSGRTCPRPHLPPQTLRIQIGPFAPPVVVTQYLRRPYIGRTTPRPHTARPILLPFVLGQPATVTVTDRPATTVTDVPASGNLAGDSAATQVTVSDRPAATITVTDRSTN